MTLLHWLNSSLASGCFHINQLKINHLNEISPRYQQLNWRKTYLIVLPPLFISLYTTWIPEWIKGLLKATQDSIRIETDPRSRQGECIAQFS